MNARTNNRLAPSSTRSFRTTRTRLLALLAGAAACVATAPAASAQDFFGMDLQPDMRSMVPVGISGIGESIVIAYKAINEKSVQVYDVPGLFDVASGVHVVMPDLLDSEGLPMDVINVMFRRSPTRAEVIPGVDVVIRKTPADKAAVWDTRDSDEGVVFDLPNSLAPVSWPNSLSTNGTIIGGSVFGDLDGNGNSRHAVVWRDFGRAELLPVPAGTRASEVWAVSEDGGFAYGAISEQGMPSDQPKMKPANSKGIIWNPNVGGGYTVVDHLAAGPDAESLAFTGVSDDGGLALATINTTRANSKGGLYAMTSGEFDLLDGGDINGDGTIDLMDDHDSAANALSADGLIIGGSITVGGEELAALWIMGAGGAYEYHDVGTYLSNLGSTGQDGWTLRAVTGVSADGSMITGVGVNPLGQTTGWYATIPAPGSIALLGLSGLVAARRRR